MGVFDFFGTVGSGWLSDRYDNRLLLFWYYGLRGLSLLYLPFADFSFYGLSLFALFYGLDWIATVPPTVKLTAAKFGRERANVVFGWVFAGHQLGAAVAAFGRRLFARRLFDLPPGLLRRGCPVPDRRPPRPDAERRTQAGGRGAAGGRAGLRANLGRSARRG